MADAQITALDIVPDERTVFESAAAGATAIAVAFPIQRTRDVAAEEAVVERRAQGTSAMGGVVHRPAESNVVGQNATPERASHDSTAVGVGGV